MTSEESHSPQQQGPPLWPSPAGPVPWEYLTPEQQAWHWQQAQAAQQLTQQLPPGPAAGAPVLPAAQSPARGVSAAVRRRPWLIGLGLGLALLLTAGLVIATQQSGPTATSAGQSDLPSVTRSSMPASTATSAAPTTTVAATTPLPPLDLGPAKAITAREWLLIAKSPDSHIGERVVVYGHVTQFDSGTGTYGFRANVDGVPHKGSYGYLEYDTNTYLLGDPATLADLVQGDLFRAEVSVAGSYSYESAMGATLTTPNLLVTKVEVTGNS